MGRTTVLVWGGQGLYRISVQSLRAGESWEKRDLFILSPGTVQMDMAYMAIDLFSNIIYNVIIA